MPIPLAWRTEKRRVNDLIPYERNPRILSAKQLDDLKHSIEKFNLAEIPVISTDNKILAGHQRMRVLQLLGRGEEKIDVRIPNRSLTNKEYEQYLLTSNAVHGDWNYDLLRSFDSDLLTTIGFSDIELSQIFDPQLETEDDKFNVEKEIAKITKPKTKSGQLIHLGPHRLFCGDATDPLVVRKLRGSAYANMIYLDPVYNLKIDYNHGIGGKQNYGGNVNDHRSKVDYKGFLKKIFVNALSCVEERVHFFCYCDQSYIGLIQELYEELGIENKRVALWIKNGFNPTPGVAFNKCYEPCVYGTIGSPYLAKRITNLSEIQNKEITTGNSMIEEILDMMDIWLCKRLAGNDYEHATSKPPTLHEKAIRRCTRPSEIILDLTAGSGSTLIAAEQMKRVAFLCELEPRFCDLIIKRYERLTGRKAKVISI